MTKFAAVASSPVWGILGLGWLGTALAEDLGRDGVTHWGTHRDAFDFTRDALPDRACDVLFLNTPPLTGMDPGAYVATVAATCASRVLFVSSTSVYGEMDGRVTEATTPRPATTSARWLTAVESALSDRLGQRLSIVRPGGLIGGTRHPVWSLSRRGTPVADGPVNLIHRDDLVALVRMVAGRSDVGVINAVAPEHPLKSVYYVGWAAKLDLPPIEFTPAEGGQRIVDSDRLPELYPRWRRGRLDEL